MNTQLIDKKQKPMPYVNLESADLKKELKKMDNIIRNLKQPLPTK